MKNELISIITPCYNGEKFLDKYFESLLNCSYSNLEIIFVNDGSIDQTENLVEKYSGLLIEKGISFVYIKKENGGLSNAINAGLKVFKGDYLIFHDVDDYYEPDAFQLMKEKLDRNKNYGVVRVNANFIDSNGKKIGEYYKKNTPKGEEIFEDLLNHKIPMGGFMFKSNVFLEFYPNRKIFESRLGQNYQLLLPITYHYKCAYIEKKLYNNLVTRNSMSHDKSDISKGIARNDAVKEILTNVLKEMNLYNQYQDIVELVYLKGVFLTYALFNEKEKLKTTYKRLKKLQGFNCKFFVVYYLAQINLFGLACRVYEKITKRVIA